jgi:ribosomal protein S19E (S16A)
MSKDSCANFVIPIQIESMPLSIEAFRLYIHLARLAAQGVNVYGSQQKAGDHCYNYLKHKDSRRNTAMRAMKELEIAGLITTSKYFGQVSTFTIIKLGE